MELKNAFVNAASSCLGEVDVYAFIDGIGEIHYSFDPDCITNEGSVYTLYDLEDNIISVDLETISGYEDGEFSFNIGRNTTRLTFVGLE